MVLRASSNTGHSVIRCTSFSSAWPHCWHVAGSSWFWFLVILLQYHANSGVCPPVRRRESRVLCEGVKSFSWSLFTHVAWGTAGLAILLHLQAQWYRMTVLAVLKPTGAAAVCGNVEASFAILSARMVLLPWVPGSWILSLLVAFWSLWNCFILHDCHKVMTDDDTLHECSMPVFLNLWTQCLVGFNLPLLKKENHTFVL